jgi:hypothetical protein
MVGVGESVELQYISLPLPTIFLGVLGFKTETETETRDIYISTHFLFSVNKKHLKVFPTSLLNTQSSN